MISCLISDICSFLKVSGVIGGIYFDIKTMSGVSFYSHKNASICLI